MRQIYCGFKNNASHNIPVIGKSELYKKLFIIFVNPSIRVASSRLLNFLNLWIFIKTLIPPAQRIEINRRIERKRSFTRYTFYTVFYVFLSQVENLYRKSFLYWILTSAYVCSDFTKSIRIISNQKCKLEKLTVNNLTTSCTNEEHYWKNIRHRSIWKMITDTSIRLIKYKIQRHNMKLS